MVDIHADDYGLTVNTSKDILDCMKYGCFDSISIISNTSAFEKSVNLLYDAIPSLPFLPLISVHITVTEGKCESNKLPMLWKDLFLSSYFYFSNRKLKNDIKEEIRKQINEVSKVVEKSIEIARENNIPYKQKNIRIDSHTHSHLIPIVWKSLVEVIEENSLQIEYLRNPKEPIIPFINSIKLIPTFNFTNFIKNRVLMFYSRKADIFCDNRNINRMYMWGLMMSGHMDYDRIIVLFDSMYEYAKKHNRNLEILFHPGFMLEHECCGDIFEDNYNKFYSSNGRNIEKESVIKLRKTITDRYEKQKR